MSAVVSTTIAIRARSARMLSRRTLSGRSGIRKVLQMKLHRLPTRVAPISHGSSENLRPQIQREEVGHERDHAQRRSAWAEPAHIDRGEHHQHEPDVGDHRVRREQRGRGDGQRGGQRQQRHRDSLPTRIGLVHRPRRDHRDQHPEQRDRERLPGGLGQQEEGQQSGRQGAGGPGGHPQPQQPGVRSDRPVTRPLVQRGCGTEHPWPASLLR